MQGLEKEIQYVKGVGPNRAALLQKLGINTLEDLITFYPGDLPESPCTPRLSKHQHPHSRL